MPEDQIPEGFFAEMAVIMVCIGAFIITPMCLCVLALCGKIDLMSLFARMVGKICPRCGGHRVGQFCAQCGRPNQRVDGTAASAGTGDQRWNPDIGCSASTPRTSSA